MHAPQRFYVCPTITVSLAPLRHLMVPDSYDANPLARLLMEFPGRPVAQRALVENERT
jgi:hypothetical protein